MTEENIDPQNKTVELLEELLKWTKASTRPTIKKIFLENLTTDSEKIIYELSDGESSPKIAKKAGIDPSTVRDYWKKWADAGIMEICPNYKRRCCKIFTLSELGIEVPETSQEKQKEENKNE
ncbi:MAG: hypothetical protein ACTSX6_06825 [Candidatus Heimdallarchaeaceae archaeon]